MACAVCEHCHGIVKSTEKPAIREGFSYHDKCHKCYVCSETNLQNAEVFKGVIFCSSCSKRIFQGCSTVRKSKKPKEKSHRRRSHRTQDRRGYRDGILELSALAASSSSKESIKPAETCTAEQWKSNEISTDFTFPDKISNVPRRGFKKSSVEIGMTTEVTQQLLREMQCPLADDEKPLPLKKPRTKRKGYKKKSDSDLRIAELGASTEIANMALKNKFEMPVYIKKSDYRLKKSMSTSELREKSDDTEENEEWMDSAYSSLRASAKVRWMDRRLRSLLKVPYTCFKKHILTRSSLLSDLASEKDQATILTKLKFLFNEEITEHQRRGLRRLYSTINRQKIPSRMGWLRLVSNTNFNRNRMSKSSSLAMRERRRRQRRCQHFRTSHSYRCMRKQVMRLAGPTSSELACFRERMKNLMVPKMLYHLGTLNRKYMLTQSCGPSRPGSIEIKQFCQME